MVGLGWAELLILLFCAGLFFGSPVLVALMFFLAQRNRQPGAVANVPAPKQPAAMASPGAAAAYDSHAEVVARLTQRFCPQCRAPLSADSPEGLCPACLMAGAMGVDVGAEPANGLAATTPPSGSKPPLDSAALAEIGDLQKLFPHLEILELLGRGGMGAVYKARQRNLDRIVALKVIPPEAAKDPAFAERFNREARALARLNHPSIVTVYDFGQVGELHYLLMEYVDGVNLRQTLRAGRLAPREALAIVPPVCDALQYAHDQGVVHRDIKPENVLLDRLGRVKIADFGLAKLLGKGPDDFTLTRTQQVMGTPRYMAPEQIERPSSVDHRADIYSLGVVLYEMLTGELPMGRFEPPSHKVAVDVRIDEVVLRSLEKDPQRRYQRASEVKTELASATSWPTLAAAASPAPALAPARPSWHTPAPATKSFAPPGGVPLAHVLMVAFGMVLGVLLMGGGIAALVWGFMIWGFLYTHPSHSDPAVLWAWWGAGFGCLVGGAGSALGSYNTYRQMAGAEDLMRTRRTTWFDWTMRGYLALGLLILLPGFVGLLDDPSEEHVRPMLLLGGIATAQAGIFLVLRTLYVFGVKPQGGAAPTRDPALEPLQAPGMGLLVGGTVAVGVSCTAFLVVGALFLAGNIKDEAQFTMAATNVVLALPAGIILILGGLTMRSARSYPLAIIACIAGMLPAGVTWLITLPLAIWALVTLREPRIKRLFASHQDVRETVRPDAADVELPQTLRQPQTASRERIRRRVAAPAIGLMIVGILGLLPCAMMVLALPAALLVPTQTIPREPTSAVVVPPLLLAQGDSAAQPLHDMARGPLWGIVFMASLMLLSLPLSLLTIIGGWRMRGLHSYGLAVIAAIAAMLPCTFGWMIGLPIGIWALVTLLNSDVREAFDQDADEPAPDTGKPPLPAAGTLAAGGAARNQLLIFGVAAVAVLVAIGVLVSLLISGGGTAREAARKSASLNNLRQIGIALHNYHDIYGAFPPAVVTDEAGKPLYSGRVLLLPYLEQGPLYESFTLDKPWDSVENFALSRVELPVFKDPHSDHPRPTTDYFFVTGAGTLFEPGKKVTMGDCKDGLANILVAVEVRGNGTNWAQPGDFSVSQPVQLPRGHYQGGNLGLFADGSVRFLSADELAPSQVRARATIAGGEPLAVPSENFEALLKSLQRESFDSGKLSFARSISAKTGLTCAQVRRLLQEFAFDTDRVEAAVELYPHVTDPENFFTVLESFTFDHDRQTVRKRLKLE
jgi:predicted Ser/Thr protein kinase